MNIINCYHAYNYIETWISKIKILNIENESMNIETKILNIIDNGWC